MKIEVIGSHNCPDTLYAVAKLKEACADVDFVNLSAGLPELKRYLFFRDTCPLYDAVKERGSIGIPLFVFEDGSVTMELSEVLAKL